MQEFSSIESYHKELLHGNITCVDTVKFFLEKIEKNKHLNCFLDVYADEVLARAQELDALQSNGNTLGKMHGVIVGLKDVLSYKDHKLSASSKIIENFVAIYNATAVDKLLAEGAIIIGRQNCDEFAMGSSSERSAFGPVLNAADNSRVPGGSSGGSAVAVQAGLCMISLGTDTGGSVRQPADFCGVVGLKPSYGLVSRYGLLAYASSFDVIGVFANNVEDAALTLEVIAGADDYDSTVYNDAVPPYSASLKENNSSKKYKIAYLKEALDNKALDSEIRKNILSTIETLKQQGHTVEMIDCSFLEYSIPTYYVLTTAEASSNLSRYDGVKYGHRTTVPDLDLNDFYKHSRSEGFGKEVQRRILLGNFVLSAGYFDAYFTKAQQVRNKIKIQLEDIFKDYDFIISPTVPAPAFKLGEKNTDPTEMFLADYYTTFTNLAGIPAISLPLYRHSNEMPFGLQLISSMKNETEMLKLSKSLMHLKNL